MSEERPILRYLLPRKISVIFDGNSDNVENIIFSDNFSSVYKMTYIKKLISMK